MKSLPSEYRALRTLASDVSKEVTPLIQLWDRAPTASVDEEGEDQDDETSTVGMFDQQTVWQETSGERVWRRLVRGLYPKTLRQWLREKPVLLDGEWLEDHLAFDVVTTSARAFGLAVVPVTGLQRATEYQAAVESLASPDRGGLVLRLLPSDFAQGRAVLAAQVESILRLLAVPASATDLVLDLSAIDPIRRERDEQNVEVMLRLLPNLDAWRNVAVVASGAPEKMSARQYPQDDLTPYSRPEWWIWRELRARESRVERMPAYGDYGTISPHREHIGEARSFARIPNIRYAFGDSVLIARGHDLRRNDDGQVQIAELVHRLQEYGCWAGPAFSDGDRWLEDASRGEASPGLWGTWKWASQVHYATHVVRQLSSLDALEAEL